MRPALTVQRLRHPLVLRLLQVRRTRLITPQLLCVTLAGEELAGGIVDDLLRQRDAWVGRPARASAGDQDPHAQAPSAEGSTIRVGLGAVAPALTDSSIPASLASRRRARASAATSWGAGAMPRACSRPA